MASSVDSDHRNISYEDAVALDLSLACEARSTELQDGPG
jgi:hypothetical protein